LNIAFLIDQGVLFANEKSRVDNNSHKKKKATAGIPSQDIKAETAEQSDVVNQHLTKDDVKNKVDNKVQVTNASAPKLHTTGRQRNTTSLQDVTFKAKVIKAIDRDGNSDNVKTVIKHGKTQNNFDDNDKNKQRADEKKKKRKTKQGKTKAKATGVIKKPVQEERTSSDVADKRYRIKTDCYNIP